MVYRKSIPPVLMRMVYKQIHSSNSIQSLDIQTIQSTMNLKFHLTIHGESTKRNEKLIFKLLGFVAILEHGFSWKLTKTYIDKWIDRYQIPINFHEGATTTGGQAK